MLDVGRVVWLPADCSPPGSAVLSLSIQPDAVHGGSVGLHVEIPTVDAFLQSQGGRGGRIMDGRSGRGGASSCPSRRTVSQVYRLWPAHRTFARVRAECFVWFTPFKLSHVIAVDASGFVWLDYFNFSRVSSSGVSGGSAA